jgi:hypothetical protein
VVVVPSVSRDGITARSGTLARLRGAGPVLLLLLRQPRLRMVYVTSLPVPSRLSRTTSAPAGVIPSHARARLTLVSVGDADPDR